MTYEEILDNQGLLLSPNKGISMMPLLRQNKDIMVLRKKENKRFKKYDAVLFKRENGQYVMHRILKVRAHDYFIAGDYTVSGEYVKDEQILAVLKEVIRDGKTISVDSWKYHCYVYLWCSWYPLKSKLIYLKYKTGRFYHRIRGDKHD